MLEAIIKFAGFGYLMALSVLGYAVLLEMIKNKYKGGGKQKMIRSVATIFHFLLGISGIMFGAFYFRDFNGANEQLGSILFAVFGFLGLIIVFYAINYLNKCVMWK